MQLRHSFALIASLGLSCLPLWAADTPSALEAWTADPGRVFEAAEVDLDALQWSARPVVVFANSPRDPAFIEQMEELEAGLAQLVERDVIVIVDTAPADASALREKLRPRGFMLVLIGKDGQIKLRKPLPWTVRELGRSIDKMPMRLQELHDS